MTSVVFKTVTDAFGRMAYGWIDTGRYTPEKLREIRKRKGVGRPPELNRERSLRWYPALGYSFYGEPSPNLAEWQRKPRKQIRA